MTFKVVAMTIFIKKKTHVNIDVPNVSTSMY